ncbi:efflux RND transporter periplasmic adaptor subunit [Dyella tabacisoli]|uniref:Efflux RND transporter periplasmic adaptor subunit n=1 Tax=Dyella tabacisoli TaxID=2282381 RepID=A0A369UTX4_9GAMM|nr:efflux RND transporter periplasmic adaptor subunit [Dyella tabacisoli]RDD83753.1 efflux RND transporter periplasmic adaptor subunit [Dyella tabacisoli]
MRASRKSTTQRWKIGAIVLVVALGSYVGYTSLAHHNVDASTDAKADTGPAQDTVTITDQQAKHVSVVPARMHDFDSRRDAVGYIDFNQDRLTQVFSPYQGRVRQVLAKTGDNVAKGQLLFTVDSPDLVQAESTLIATAATRALTSKTLDRARKMLEIQASAQKDVDQASSDQQSAEAGYKAARDALRIFGKSDVEMDHIAASRKIDGELHIVSPYAGLVTARNVAPGVLVQPGNAPAPFTVADVSTLWMIANVAETDVALLQTGQQVSVTVDALPGRKLQGVVGTIGSAIDPSTHHIAVRSEIRDPHHELRPQMLASFQIRTGEPTHSVAVPVDAVVREGDGTMTVFTTQDGRHFMRRPIKLGQQQDGLNQILEGLSANERVAGDGALFLSNALALQSK